MMTSKVKPTLSGDAGNAWLVPIKESDEFSTAIWLLHVPRAHPFWSYYALNVYHLRGGPEPIIYLPGATHEITLAALDPDFAPDLSDFTTWRRMAPLNFFGQMICESDGTSAARARFTAQEIVNGQLSPDTDYIRQWVQRFGDHCLKK